MADKEAKTSTQESSTQPVINLLTNILNEFKNQVQSNTQSPLGQKAADAQAAFKEISAALDV